MLMVSWREDGPSTPMEIDADCINLPLSGLSLLPPPGTRSRARESQPAVYYDRASFHRTKNNADILSASDGRSALSSSSSSTSCFCHAFAKYIIQAGSRASSLIARFPPSSIGSSFRSVGNFRFLPARQRPNAIYSISSASNFTDLSPSVPPFPLLPAPLPSFAGKTASCSLKTRPMPKTNDRLN